MNPFRKNMNKSSRGSLKNTAWLLLTCLLAFSIHIPDASAIDNCDASLIADIVGERVQLKSCASDFDGANNDTSNELTFPVGTDIAVGDLLIAHVANDSTDEIFNAPPAGWTQLEAQLDGQDLNSQIWYKVAAAVDITLPTYIFSWPGGEQNGGFLLHFTGTSSIATIPGSGFQFISDPEGNNDATPDLPIVTALSPFNVILRTIAARQTGLDNAPLGPGNNAGNVWGPPPYNDIIQERTQASGGGANNQMGVAAAYAYQAAAGDSTAEFVTMAETNGTHLRSLAIEPYEFRFFLEDTTTGAAAQSMVCGIREVTLRVTDRLGNTVPTFTGTVTLGTSTGNGNWTKTTTAADAQGGLSDTPGDDNGVATYEFVTTDNGEMILNFENRNAETVNFNVTFGNWTESTTPGYVSPNLVINPCEIRISYTDANPGTMGICSQEAISLEMRGTGTGNEVATNYPGGTLTIDNNLTSHGSYVKASGDGTVTDGGGDGTATIVWPASSSSVVLTYSDDTASNNVNFTVTENSVLGIIDSTTPADDPNLNVLSCDIRLVYPT
ncbi:MAG: hypothetical protein ACJA2D_000930, partial [Pseudohongiellaceae bacterium]